MGDVEERAECNGCGADLTARSDALVCDNCARCWCDEEGCREASGLADGDVVCSPCFDEAMGKG